MNEHHSPPEEAVKLGYEPHRVSRRFVIFSTLGLVLLVLLGLLAAYGVSRYVTEDASPMVQRPEVLRSTESRVGVRVTADQPAQLRELRQSEERRLNEYGWVVRPEGIARIPIERAMEIIAQQGLPKQPQPANPPSQNTEEQNTEEPNDNAN